MTELAYIKGEEEKALWYYSQRIKYEIDPCERTRLKEIIDDLRKFLTKSASRTPSEEESEVTLTSIPLSNHSSHT